MSRAGPTWYDQNYLYRAPIVVDGSATASGTVDATITIPETHEFWLQVQSTGYDVRFTTSNGYTLLAYNRATWTYASKVGIFNIDGITHHTTNTMTVIWMYWGYSGATDGSSSPTISGALNAYLWVGTPVRPAISMGSEFIGATTPAQSRQKTANEALGLWWRLPALSLRQVPWQGSTGYEGPRSLIAGGGPGATPHLTSTVRVILANNALFAFSLLTGGTDGNSYDTNLRVTTTDERIVQGTIAVIVEDL